MVAKGHNTEVWLELNHLTLEVPITKNTQKLPFLIEVPNFWKISLWIHVTVGSCIMLDWEDVGKNSEFSTV